MIQCTKVEMSRKAEIIAVYDNKTSATGKLVWNIKPETISISYGRILNRPASGIDFNNHNTRGN